MKFFLFKTFTFSPRPLLTFVRDRAVYGALREIVEDFDMGGRIDIVWDGKRVCDLHGNV